MTKIKSNLQRSDKIALLNQLRKGQISINEFIQKAAQDDSVVFIQRGHVYHLSGTDVFIMGEEEFEEHVGKENYSIIAILPWAGDKAFNGEEFIDWPSQKSK